MKRMMVLVSLMLALMLPFASLAEEAAQPDPLQGLMFTATVEPASETALKAPASGELEPFTLRPGDVVTAGETLFAVKPGVVYAEADGVVAAVYVEEGDTASGAMNRYGAVMYIDYTDRYYFSGDTYNSRTSIENRDLHVGAPVYFRSTNKQHTADGVITQVNGRQFTAQVIGGNLDFTERLEVFRESDYNDASRLSEGRLSASAPYGVTASGTVLTVAVKPGDAVKAGDALLTYVPDVLAPQQAEGGKAVLAMAQDASVVLSVAAQQGGSVQKGQPLATLCALGDYQLVINAEECDVGRFAVGATLRVTFEELDLEPLTATVTGVGALGSGGEVSTYPVYLSFEAPEGVLLGMHATVEGI